MIGGLRTGDHTERRAKYAAYLQRHTLERDAASPTGRLEAYYLRPADGGRMESVYVVFTPEGIVVMGDWCPALNGCISTSGYGVAWFTGRLSDDYLCEKFLRKEWVPEYGYDELKFVLLDARALLSITKEQARDAYDTLTSLHPSELSHAAAYEIFSDAGLCDFENLGWHYNPRNAAMLVAIQERFAARYHAMYAKSDLGQSALTRARRYLAALVRDLQARFATLYHESITAKAGST